MANKKTYVAKIREIRRKTYVIDAEGAILGRLATRIAVILRGKNKPIFTPHVDCGDIVVVINAEKVKVTGRKEKQKDYFTHSGYPGGDRHANLEKMRILHPDKIIRLAVRGMLPKTRLGDKIINKLKVVIGDKHLYSNAEKIDVSAEGSAKAEV